MNETIDDGSGTTGDVEGMPGRGIRDFPIPIYSCIFDEYELWLMRGTCL